MSDPAVAIVTGAARGIGAATALVFSERGYRLALVDCQAEELQAVCTQVTTAGTEAMALSGDLADLAFSESIVQAAFQRWGRIDVLVNNAAWREIITMRSITVESWERTLRINLTAPAFLARWAALHMEQRGRGAIVNVSSIMSQHASGFSPAYVASKGAIESLTYELASLYGPSGVRVVGIRPGAIDTEMSRDVSGALQHDNGSYEFSEEMIMLRRWGKPEEIARAIAWIVSDDASYFTGTTLTLDGGWLHQHLPYGLTKRLLD